MPETPQPGQLRESLEAEILDTIEVAHPRTSDRLGFHEYLALDPELRTGDERPFVDSSFTPRLLDWLGFDEADWDYDRPEEHTGDRPDFRVRPQQAVAFVIEDKNSTEEFGAKHVEQLRRYTAGTQGYALWTNASVVLALRFYPGGDWEILARVPVNTRQLSLTEDDETTLALFRTLFEKRRFVEMPGILDRISVSEETWERDARRLDTPEAQREFIEETKDLLEKLTLAARVQVERAEADVSEAQEDIERTRSQLKEEIEDLVETLGQLPPDQREPVEEKLQEIVGDPMNADEEKIKQLKPEEMGLHTGRDWDKRVASLLATLADFREREVQRLRSRRIHNSFEVWKDRYRIIEGEEMTESRRRNAYAEQVAYTFFIRLLLARILEDKKAIGRVISDGGLETWRKITEPSLAVAGEDEVALHGRALLDVLFQTVSKFYQHFFSQPVFDWFMPDDYLLALALERLTTFSFAEINRDILGFAYEAYVEQAFRREKGHFLTRGEIVEYILEEAGYEGREIIGRKVLDPAAGSGSFLVHAARRLRNELEQAVQGTPGDHEDPRAELARTFIERIQSDFVGLEINPFSCYLAELNLFLQALDDILYLWKETDQPKPVEQFQIFNTDSLVLSQPVLENQHGLEAEGATLGHDQAKEVKLEGEKTFDYVVMNPPYINRGIQHDLRDLTDIPFYNVLFGGGDTNYYHAFIRLANHFVREEGVVSLICPLQLYGDRSAGGIRRWLAAPTAGSPPDELQAEWTVRSLTRFYSRTVLFENVLQAVCVSTWERTNGDEQETSIKVAGGWDIEDARSNHTTYEAERVLAADPITVARRQQEDGENRSAGTNFTDEWLDAWAVVVEDGYLDAWEQIREAATTDVEHWAQGSLIFHKGDVNMTRTKPLRCVSEGGKVEGDLEAPVPTAGSKDMLPFGPYQQSGQLDAEANVPSMNLSDQKKRDADRERRERVLRIYELDDTEAVCVLKEISGIEPARPIMGALYHRGGGEAPICFEDTTQIIFAQQPADSYLTEALFGFLVSSAANFMFSLFSTNQHVGTYEIRRLLLPELADGEIRQVGTLAREVQSQGEEYWEAKKTFGCGSSIMAIEPRPRTVLSGSDVETETLEEAVLRDHLTVGGPDYHLSTLMDRGDITAVEEARYPEYVRCVELVLSSIDARYEESSTSVALPVPDEASDFLDHLDTVKSQLDTKQEDFLQALAALDRYVLSLYGITDLSTCRLIGSGMPWASMRTDWADAVAEQLDAV